MRTSAVVRTTVRDLAYEFISVLYNEWRAVLCQGNATRTAKKISGYIAAVIGISLAINVILTAAWYASDNSHALHYTVNGLHIAVPDSFRGIPVEQLLPLP